MSQYFDRWRPMTAGLVLALSLVSPACTCAQDTEPVDRALKVELTFVDDRVELGAVRRTEAPVPRQYGTPQLEPLFFEVTGADGDVLYAGTLGDPREMKLEHGQEGSGSEDPDEVREATGGDYSAEVTIPDLPDAREIAVYRRETRGTEDRTQLMRAALSGGGSN